MFRVHVSPRFSTTIHVSLDKKRTKFVWDNVALGNRTSPPVDAGLPLATASPWASRPKRRTVPRPNCATHPAGLIRPPTSAFDRRPLRLDHGDASAGPRATAGRADIGVRRLGVGVVGTGKHGAELRGLFVRVAARIFWRLTTARGGVFGDQSINHCREVSSE